MTPHKIASATNTLFKGCQPISLTFGGTIELGPKKLIVHTIKNSDELQQLHTRLLTALNALDVEYEYPEYVGAGHKPHVTQRKGVHFSVGNTHVTHTAHLIEIVNGKRVIRTQFN